MVQLLPIRRNGATRYFTRSLADPCATTLVDEILRLRAAVRAVHRQMPFQIDAWVVLPDHLHAIWTLPEGDSAFEPRWHAIMTTFAAEIPDTVLTPAQIAAGRDQLWAQQDTMQEITDREEFENFRLRCWQDPVSYGFVGSPRDWPYSSYHRDTHCCSGGADVPEAFLPELGAAPQATVLSY